MDRPHLIKVAILALYFIVLAFTFYYLTPGYSIWLILLASAFIWLIVELSKKKEKKLITAALMLGIFLMLFDFVVQNIGGYLNLWHVDITALHVLYVPIEVMLLCVVGGTAWALAQPKKPEAANISADILLFSVFGTVGEFVLMENGLISYEPPWTSGHAIVSYFLTWIILHYVWHKKLKPK